jgi:gamma-glutamyltranspeptidase/glutathione hydrolase
VRALVDAQLRALDFRRHRLDVADDRVAVAAELAALVDEWRHASPSTAHVSVVDADGTACAITASSGYGSGATLPGTGIWLNNCLGEHELNRGAPPAVGARLASNMAPTVGRTADGSVLAIGTPGADRITTALTQVLAAFTRGGAGLQEAVDRPRLHVHHLDDDPDGPVRVEAEEDLPHPSLPLPVRLHPARSMYFGGVGAALLRPDGSLEAAADPRRDGATAVTPS